MEEDGAVEKAQQILATMRSPGYAYLEASIQMMLQSLAPLILDESDKAKQARVEAKTYQKILAILNQKREEAKVIVAEKNKELDADTQAKAEA